LPPFLSRRSEECTTTAGPRVSVRELRKCYGDVEAVRGIEFEGYALGPNGAGKTTTVEILEGIRTPGRPAT
jgi:ABC-2 type transport system ATP-binding protein